MFFAIKYSGKSNVPGIEYWCNGLSVRSGRIIVESVMKMSTWQAVTAQSPGLLYSVQCTAEQEDHLWTQVLTKLTRQRESPWLLVTEMATGSTGWNHGWLFWMVCETPLVKGQLRCVTSSKVIMQQPKKSVDTNLPSNISILGFLLFSYLF